MSFKLIELSLAFGLFIDGIAQVLFIKSWWGHRIEISNQNQQLLQGCGGYLLAIGAVLLIIFS
ncbi:DUF2065 domain-containing protein [Shewanella sairae]|nr:DUF2065 domain-containing protein [Shewanella sairae]MCL1128721.1 DUF2065 domain-containing protein [Shewanella sairae]